MAANEINWSELRAAAIALQNVNEAAKRAAANLPKDEQRRFIERVNKRSQREHWIQKANALAPVYSNTKPLSKSVQSGSSVLASVLEEDNRETKIGLSQYARKQAKYLSAKGKLKDHHAFKNITSGANQLHGWDQEGEGAGTLSGLRVYSKQTIVHVDQTNAKAASTRPDESDAA